MDFPFDFPGRDRLDLIDLLTGADPFQLRWREAAVTQQLHEQTQHLDGVRAVAAKYAPTAHDYRQETDRG